MSRRTQAKQRQDVEDGISPSSSKKCKPSTPTPDVVLLSEKAPPGFNQDLLRCPICSQFPRKEVYQCNTGHSVCATCLPKLRKCPSCKGLFKKVRNYLAEGLLDSMQFECSWKDFGCKAASVARTDLTSHEAQCHFNPNSVKFCSVFFDEYCKNKFCPISTQDPAEMRVFLDHVKSAHDFAVRYVNHREPFLINLNRRSYARVLWRDNPALFNRQGQLFKAVFRLRSPQTNQNQDCHQLFVVLGSFEHINEQTSLLIKCVRLTDENRGKMSISFSLKPGQRGEDAPQLPELSWTVKPQGLRELEDLSQDHYLFLGTPPDDLSSYHMISQDFLRNYITEEGITIKCMFG